MSAFQIFSKLVHDRYNKLAKHELFVAGEDNRALEAKYLAAFPDGTNPVYKTNTEHDCTCCKQFIRNLGNVVAIIDGKVETIWAIEGAPYPYDVVAKAMDESVAAQKITSVFRTQEPSYGAETSNQRLEDGNVKRWNHFHGKVSSRHLTDQVGTVVGEFNTGAQLLKRALDELTPRALEDVVGLIESNALYRGEEHKASVKAFQAAQREYRGLVPDQQGLFVWLNAKAGFARFRNTVIGTLVQDLSAGDALEAAVRSFEAKVAPTNYKRPTALITPRMVQDAMKTIQELGLEQALERRFARISDVSVNNVLWVNNTTQSQMRGGIESVLMSAAVAGAPKDQKADAITIDEFMARVLPAATGIDLLVKGTHMPNFMSLTAPVHGSEGKLFKWGNDFGWSYDGNITDSIKEKVKAAGGNVTNAKLRVSLAWFNHDDLDIHVREPSGNHIYFGNKSYKLDVDMNAGGGSTRTPVENVSWTTVADGKYEIVVDQWCQRETSNVGCVVEIESGGQITQLSYAKAPKKNTPIATLTVVGGKVTGMALAPGVRGEGISQDKWGVKTETFVKVNTLMHSPNHWDDNAAGNKHWFFVLDGCKTPDAARGIYNEFLNPGLEKHRKVFEVLGDKTKCQPADDQLSGLGFSSTRGDTVTVKVTGPTTNKTFNVTF